MSQEAAYRIMVCHRMGMWSNEALNNHSFPIVMISSSMDGQYSYVHRPEDLDKEAVEKVLRAAADSLMAEIRAEGN